MSPDKQGGRPDALRYVLFLECICKSVSKGAVSVGNSRGVCQLSKPQACVMSILESLFDTTD